MHQNFSYSTKKSEIGSKCADSLNGVMVHTSDWLWLNVQQAAIQEKNMFNNTWKLYKNNGGMNILGKLLLIDTWKIWEIV